MFIYSWKRLQIKIKILRNTIWYIKRNKIFKVKYHNIFKKVSLMRLKIFIRTNIHNYFYISFNHIFQSIFLIFDITFLLLIFLINRESRFVNFPTVKQICKKIDKMKEWKETIGIHFIQRLYVYLIRILLSFFSFDEKWGSPNVCHPFHPLLIFLHE